MTITSIKGQADDSNENKTLAPFIRRSCSLLKKPNTYSAQVSVGHWQLRDLIRHSCDRRHPNEILYTHENTIRSTNKTNNKVTQIHNFDFHPRCFNVADSNIISGGVVSSLAISSHTFTPNLMEDRGFQSQDSPKGLLGLYNRETDESLTVKLGSFINNHVSISKTPTGSYQSYVCNNDMHLYSTAIRNTSISLTGSLNLNFPLNHSALSEDSKTLIVVGDSQNIYLLHPEQDTQSSRLARDNVIETNCDSGFSTSFDSSGVHFATCFQDGSCLIYDLRNYSNGPLHKISSTRKNTSNGAFRCVKYSQGTDDLLFISEHIGRVHMVDTRDFTNHQVIMLPVNTIQSKHPGAYHSNVAVDPESNIFKPAVLTFDEVVGFEDSSRNPGVSPLDMSDDGPFGFAYLNSFSHQSHSRNTSNFNVLSSLTSTIEEDEYEDENSGGYGDVFSNDLEDTQQLLEQLKATASRKNSMKSRRESSIHKKNQSLSSVESGANLMSNNNGEHLTHARTNSFGSEYDYADNEISGIDWYEDTTGSHLIVGCDNGLIDWTIDSWSRRSFPSYQIL
ncbi:hypothetical protein WICPIJ_008740 [Wickerhamomyces pijperi]|uniref:DUF2415 domain-containing protein n=1 Tax=Wickerhamomyces pijperi TaxID=599730 RepID=A0A9P8PVW3_WICPI|nr:hypothetical protein WICPIJ_008740 [Wickerhamomyces pijperi]